MVLRRVDFMEAVIPGSREGLSLYDGTLREVSPIVARCLRRGFVDKKPIDLRSASCDIVIALGSAEFTLSTGEGIGIFSCDVVSDCLC